MPNPLVNVACGDAYTDAATISNVWNGGQGGWFYVSTNSVYFELQYGIQGDSWWMDELPLAPGASASLPKECIGVRFRNAVAGEIASVTGQIYYGGQPLLDLTFPGAAAGSAEILVLGQGHKTGTNGAATVLGTSLACQSVVVRALPGNTGLVYLGTTTVTTSNGYELSPGDALGMDVGNVNLVYFDVDVNGEGVSWVAVG